MRGDAQRGDGLLARARAAWEAHAEVLLYLFFGGCTTLVNWIAYWAAAHPLGWGVMPATVVAWVLAVLFAYLTNRRWVFHSAASGVRETAGELASFFSCRLATGVVDWGCMFCFVDVLGWNDMAVKLFANILVVILNYVASRLLVFRRREQ